MDSKDGVIVIRALLHQAAELPGGGGVETSLYKAKGVTMVYCDDGLYCEYKGKQFIVPLANVVCVHV